MISFDRVSFAYPDCAPILSDVSFDVPEGELWVVVGATGAGKSTLLRCVNGLVPHFSGGTMSGEVRVAGRSTRTTPPRELADVVGYVGQDPRSGFVTDVVEDEVAYVLENLGVDRAAMRRRVEDALDLVDLGALRRRGLQTLSGGQQQRVAIAAALAASARVLVLDEPTSSLDPAGADEVLAALTRLVHDVGLTVFVAEHRLERVIHHADVLVHLPGRGSRPVVGRPVDVLAGVRTVPPVVELARVAGWAPVPLSVRDARRMAQPLRTRIADAAPPRPAVRPSRPVAHAHGLFARFGPVVALAGVDLSLDSGEVTAVMGRNGAGKSTLLAHLAGLRRPDGGSVEVLGVAPASLSPRDAVRRVGLVPQDPGLLLYAQSVGAELEGADRDLSLSPGSARQVADRLVAGLPADAHPRDLSEGQRLALALAVVTAARPPLVLLDEPTRGLDYAAKARLGELVTELASTGHAVVVATHDVEFVARFANRVVLLADGEVVADGSAREVVTQSPVFAPQVAKILDPVPLLTVDEVRAALAEGA